MIELSGKRLIIYGASENGRIACEYLSENNEILFVCDGNDRKWGQTMGEYTIVSPECILQTPNVIVVVAIVKRYNEVIFWLYDNGVQDVWRFVEYYNLVSMHNEMILRRIPKNPQFCIFDFNSDYKITRVKSDICTSNNVLFFANYFPPIGGSGVQRPLKFAKYLKKFGYEPIVVTKGNCERVMSFDHSLLEEIDSVRIVRIQESPYYPEEMTYDDHETLMALLTSIGLDDSWLEKYHSILENKWELLPDIDVMWVLSCIKSISEAVDLNTISIVYTTIGPYSSALFGAYLKIRYGIKWVLDYRDPWCLNDYNMRVFYEFRMPRRGFEMELETVLLNMADHIVASAEVFCKDFLKYCPGVKTSCITNGYDEDDFCGINSVRDNNSPFVVLFNGYFYPNYDLNLMLEVLNGLINKGLLDKDMVRLEFNGRDPSEYSGFMDLDVYGIVRYNGYLSHKKSLESLFSASILLLYGLYGEGAYLGYSGKLFEYMRTGIPILSISSPYGVQHEMVEEHGHGITATSEDKEKIKEFILEQYTEWKDNKTVQIKEPDDYVRSFSRECLTKRLADVFDEVLSV